VYFWLPKATGIMFSERLGRLHFILMVIGTNIAFLPMFGLGMLGMPRRVPTYPGNEGLNTLNLLSSIGAFLLGLSFLVFLYNLYVSARRKEPVPPDPWGGQTLEWATSSPPPRFNFNGQFPVPKVRSYAPLLDLRERRARSMARAGGENGDGRGPAGPAPGGGGTGDAGGGAAGRRKGGGAGGREEEPG
jgi:cytochrome c oxidase subunit 1